MVLVGDAIGGQAGGLGERRSRQPVQACCCADVYRAALRWSKHSDMAVTMSDPRRKSSSSAASTLPGGGENSKHGFSKRRHEKKTFQKGRSPILQAELSKRLPGQGLVDF